MNKLDQVGLSSVMEKLTWYELLVFMGTSKTILKTGRNVFSIKYLSRFAFPQELRVIYPLYYTIHADAYSETVFRGRNPEIIYQELLHLVKYIELTTKSTCKHVLHCVTSNFNPKLHTNPEGHPKISNILYVAKDPLTLVLMRFIEDMEETGDISEFLNTVQLRVTIHTNKKSKMKERRESLKHQSLSSGGSLNFNNLLSTLFYYEENIYISKSKEIYQNIQTERKILIASILEQEDLELCKYADFVKART